MLANPLNKGLIPKVFYEHTTHIEIKLMTKERTQICKEEELGCSDHPEAASDHHCSSHIRYGGDGFGHI
ncbi:hypothetical protein CR513_09478, partial [Mucuna pruriens]